MQRLQRQAGKLLHRSADDAEVGSLLKDFEDLDKALKVIVESAKAYRVSWTEILQHACGIATDFDDIYQFIPGEENEVKGRLTTRDQLAKVKGFKDTLAEARDIIIGELASVERSVAVPARDARKHLDIYRKYIKRREDRKLDWERYKSRTDAMERKSNKSEREERAWMKHQIDLDVSEKAYVEADEHIKQTLPDLIRAVFALIPRLGHSMIVIQNNMLAHYYTSLHEYCQSYGYPIPSPEWNQVQSEYDDVFARAKQHTETISILQQGRAVKQPFHSRPDSLQTRTVNHSANGNPRRSDINQGGAVGKLPPPVPSQQQQQQHLSPPPLDFGSKPTRVSSSPSYASRPSPPGSVTSFHTARDYAPSVTSAGASRVSSHINSPSLSRATTSPQVRTLASSVGGSQANAPALSSAAIAAAAIASKKKPPPPPPKRKPSDYGAVYVIAQYDFEGEGEGDLHFKEGDRIKVVKRTESENDWWEGECRGIRGSFPANYCKAA